MQLILPRGKISDAVNISLRLKGVGKEKDVIARPASKRVIACATS